MRNYQILFCLTSGLVMVGCSTVGLQNSQVVSKKPSSRTIASETPAVFNIRCDDASATQFVGSDGKAGPIQVNRTKEIETRTVTQDGDYVVYKTNATAYNNEGVAGSTFTATRRTKTATLANNIIRETSDTQTASVYNGQTTNGGSHTVTDFQVDQDGSKKMIHFYKDGEEIKDAGSEFQMTTADGITYIVDEDNQESDDPQDDGSNLKTLQYKSICVISPQK